MSMAVTRKAARPSPSVSTIRAAHSPLPHSTPPRHPLLTSLHGPPVTAHQNQNEVLAFHAVRGSSTAYLQKIIRPYPLCQTSWFSPSPSPYRLFWLRLPVEVTAAETLNTLTLLLSPPLPVIPNRSVDFIFLKLFSNRPRSFSRLYS